MKLLPRTLIVSALIAAHGLAAAGPRHYEPPRHHHHHRGGIGFGGALLGLAIAVPLIAIASRHEREPEVVYVPPPAPLPPVVIQQAPPPARGEPIIYPRNGQSYEQTEFDRRECNRWASTQQSAMNDATVFNRAVDACMDGRGYTLR